MGIVLFMCPEILATIAGDLAALRDRLSLLEAKIAQVQSAMQALDTTILLVEARVRPAAAGMIRRHKKGYGARGALRAFIVETLHNTHRPLTTRDNAVVACMHFGLEFETGPDFNRYQRNTIRAQLYLLVDEGSVLKTGAEGCGRCIGSGSVDCPPWPSWRCSPATPQRRVRLMATNTRPDIKWLINETAMLQGELERIDQEMARLVALRASVEHSRAACQRTLEYQAGRKVPGPPTVRAHRQYGRRGDLQQFLADTLKDLAPAQLNTAQLAEKAFVRFDLAMSCPTELYDFKMNTVGRALRRLQALGLIERLTTMHRVDRALGTWRWKAPVATLGQLERMVAAGTAADLRARAGAAVGAAARG